MPASGDAEEDMSNGLGKEVIIFSTEEDKDKDKGWFLRNPVLG